MAKRDYLVDAARQIRMALDREVSEDYEAAFNYYKKGVDLLLNGIQVDPNMERREAVKRKTTQYLKRAEDIFLSHLQNNMEKEGSQMIGSSSLRFRPIRRLNALVEDLKMYKVIDIGDKVLTVESIICKDTFVIKSLPKTSGNSQSRPTIIPQEVPYMVKLLRYYVSEDSIYLHLEHVTGGKLFSNLHNLRRQASRRDRPESFSTGHHHQKSCTLSSSSTHRRPPGQHVEGLQSASGLRSTNTHTTKHTEGEHPAPAPALALASEGDHPAPAPAAERDYRAPAPASWLEAQRQMESCRTHSYCEETGCLQQHSKLIQETLIKQARMEASQHATAAATSHSNNNKNHTHGASQQQHPTTATASCCNTPSQHATGTNHNNTYGTSQQHQTTTSSRNIPSQQATATASVHSNNNNTHGTSQQHPTTTTSFCNTPSQHATGTNHDNTYGTSQQQHPTTSSCCNIPPQHATATASVHSNNSNTHGTSLQHSATTSSPSQHATATMPSIQKTTPPSIPVHHHHTHSHQQQASPNTMNLELTLHSTPPTPIPDHFNTPPTSIPVHFSARSHQQVAANTTNSEFSTSYNEPDKIIQSSKVVDATVCNCIVYDPLQRCECSRTECSRTECSGGKCHDADNGRTLLQQNRGEPPPPPPSSSPPRLPSSPPPSSPPPPPPPPPPPVLLSRKPHLTSKALQEPHPCQNNSGPATTLSQTSHTSQGPPQVSGVISTSHPLSIQGHMPNAETGKPTNAVAAAAAAGVEDKVCLPHQINSAIASKAMNPKSCRLSSSPPPPPPSSPSSPPPTSPPSSPPLPSSPPPSPPPPPLSPSSPPSSPPPPSPSSPPPSSPLPSPPLPSSPPPPLSPLPPPPSSPPPPLSSSPPPPLPPPPSSPPSSPPLPSSSPPPPPPPSSSLSGSVWSPRALSIRGVGQLHTGDSTGGKVLPGTRCGDERDSLQNTDKREETQGQLGSLQKEEPQRRHSRESESESSLRSPPPPPPSSSGFVRVDTPGHGHGTPPEPSAREQAIEVHGSPLRRRSLQDGSVQTSRGGAQHGHWGLPEEEVQAWGAQILMALESLHQQGVVCCDLNPNNILLTDDGAVCLTFFGQWSEVEPRICTKAMEQMYCAPEVGGVGRVNEAADWWSLGALLFELLTGMPLWQCHPTGVTSHTQLHVPEHLSTAAASLLTELLQLDAGYRLGSGGGGVSDIKCHPFFHSVEWADLES